MNTLPQIKRSFMQPAFSSVIAIFLVSLQGVASSAEDVSFSRNIRAVLSDKCFQCHGPDEGNRKSDLRLDVRDDALSAGVLIPGDANASEIVARMTSDDPDLVMPPPSTGKEITADEASRFRAWIEEGAPYDEHWAFVPPTRPNLPEVSDPSWCKNPIDFFVMAKLDGERRTPAPVTDRNSLLRRVYLDLIGLPPSPSAIASYANSDDVDAYTSVVDSLMKSPHFGERWARWWLDAARYSDSDGYEKDKQREVWFYRDWVTKSLNRDMPYDEFVVKQIAGDLLAGAGQDEIVATGFLRNSMVNEEGGADPEQFRVEGMFDRMDAIGKAMLGITTQCAQCHTHKFDPLTHDEYYSMFAALNDFHEAIATVYTPDDRSLRESLLEEIVAAENALKATHPDWEKEIVAWQNTLAAGNANWTTVIATDLPYEGQKFRLLDDGSILSESYAPTKMDNSFPCVVEPGTVTAVRLDALMHPQLPHGGPGRSIDGTGALTEFEVTAAPQSDPSRSTKLKISRAIADVNPDKALLPPAYREKDAANDKRSTGGIEMAIDGDNATAWSTDNGPGRRNQDRHAVFVFDEPLVVTEPTILSFRLVMKHGGWNSDDNQNYLIGRYKFSVTNHPSPIESFVTSAIEHVIATPWEQLSKAEQALLVNHWRMSVDKFAETNALIESMWKLHPAGTSQLTVKHLDEPRKTFVMLRGDFLKPGIEVKPGTPAFLNAMRDSDEPDRLRFARWIVDDRSPTTARVIVNRIWQSYFGRGIVSTPEDFGYQSPSPTHPELLDWLAVELMENQWRLKHIHRLIVQSAVYQQSSVITPESFAVDPYNECLARGARFRVDAELVRDIALSVSGLLNEKVGGPSVYPPAPDFLFEPPASYGPKIWNAAANEDQYRRSLYVHSYRSTPYPTMQVFDAPKGDAACVRRDRSNTPLQALVVLNEPQFVECARAMATRILRESPGADDVSRIQFAHQLATGRNALPDEVQILGKLLKEQRKRVASGEINVPDVVGVSEQLCKQLTGVSASETLPWIVLARVLLNLDETITKS